MVTPRIGRPELFEQRDVPSDVPSDVPTPEPGKVALRVSDA